MMKFIEKTDGRIQTLENQMSTLATLMSQRVQGTLPTQTEPNPKEQAKAITLRSGKELSAAPQKEEQVVAKEKKALIEGSTSEEGEKGKVDHEP